VNRFLSDTNKRFVKAPFRIKKCKNKLPDISLHPEYILTSWRTCNYTDLSCSDRSEDVNPFLYDLNYSDAILFHKGNRAHDSKTVHFYLSIIKSHFKIIVQYLKKREKFGMSVRGVLHGSEKEYVGMKSYWVEHAVYS
jgi:hypothetical protein